MLSSPLPRRPLCAYSPPLRTIHYTNKPGFCQTLAPKGESGSEHVAVPRVCFPPVTWCERAYKNAVTPRLSSPPTTGGGPNYKQAVMPRVCLPPAADGESVYVVQPITPSLWLPPPNYGELPYTDILLRPVLCITVGEQVYQYAAAPRVYLPPTMLLAEGDSDGCLHVQISSLYTVPWHDIQTVPILSFLSLLPGMLGRGHLIGLLLWTRPREPDRPM